MSTLNPYTGPPLPCGWPGCQKTFKNPFQRHCHSMRCFGHGLPALNTGIKCDILDCRCSGVDFPSAERLLKHKKNVSNRRQCLSRGCGCGRWFSSLPIHLAKKRSARQKQTASGADLRPSNESEPYFKDHGKRANSVQHAGEVKEEGDSDQDIGDEYMNVDKSSENHSDEGDDNEDDDDWDPEYLPPSKPTKSNKSSTIKTEARDDVSLAPTHPAKRKSDVIDLTNDSYVDENPGAFKEVNVAASVLSPRPKPRAIPKTKVAAEVPVASSSGPKSHAADQSDNVTTKDLLELLKSQQSQMAVQANQIAMLTEAVLTRK